MRLIARACMVVALMLVCGAATIADAPAPTATPRPAASPGSTADTPFCPLSTSVLDVDDAHSRYAVDFRGLETGLASGVVSLYAGNRRYGVPFHNAVVLDTRDLKTPATPIVVRFPVPTVLDGAGVTALDNNGRTPCDPIFSPWSSKMTSYPRSGVDRAREEAIKAKARAAAAVDAPPPVDDPVSCAVPYRAPRTLSAFEPTSPYRGATGLSVILVLLGPDDRVIGARVQESAGNTAMDIAALHSARLSQFEGSIFRCRHVFGTYLFSVDFGG